MKISNQKKLSLAMLLGILGCLCYGSGDWLMMYGNAAYEGNLNWLTAGVSQIPEWKNNLAMILAFPGIIFYGTALFYLGTFIKSEKERKIYHYLNAFGLTPWICLHLFYVMILFLYAWMVKQGYGELALFTCEALYQHFSWIVIVSEILMLPVFLYWFYVVMAGKTIFNRAAAFGNVLVFYLLFKIIASLMPENGFRLGFTNGLMSESMIPFFLILWICAYKKIKKGSFRS